MNKFKIAIADDEMEKDERKEIYKKMFDADFEIVEYASMQDKIMALQELNVHAYVLDVYYLGKCSGIKIEEIIENIRKRKKTPIILISSKWTERENISILNRLTQFDNIICFYAWNEIATDDEDAKYGVRNKIKYELKRYYQTTSINLDPNEPIRILQLSDLQFGDNNIDPQSSFSKWDVPRFLVNIKRQPHILVISGDIASHGKDKEYEAAAEWIKQFCHKLWPNVENIADHLVIVPGNHDVDLNFCLADEHAYKWEGEEIKTVQVKEVKDVYQKYAMFPYAMFMRKLTGNISYLDNYDGLFRVNERFLNLGLRFYELNTAMAISHQNMQRIDIDDESYKKMKNDTSENEENVFNIMVGHHSPSSLGFNKDDSSEQNKWAKMRSFIESAHIHMYLYGHQHQVGWGRLNDQAKGANYSKKLVYSLASTFSLNSKARPGDENKGFTVIEMERKEGVVKKVTIYPYEFQGSTPISAWQEGEEDTREFSITI